MPTLRFCWYRIVISHYLFTFTENTNVLYYVYKMCDCYITHTDTVTDLEVQLDPKLQLRAHLGCIFSHYVRMLSLIPTLSLCCFLTDSLLMLYLVLVRPTLKYT
jgi:hypothetical protein